MSGIMESSRFWSAFLLTFCDFRVDDSRKATAKLTTFPDVHYIYFEVERIAGEEDGES
jgi:hypothetical protein